MPTQLLLTPLDSTLHDVNEFRSGVDACDEDIRGQARKAKNRCLVMAESRRILAYGRYAYAEGHGDIALRPCIRIDFIARDVTADPGTGTDFTLRMLVRIARDPRSFRAKVVLIDSMNCGDPVACARRWRFFTEKVGFTPLRNDGNPYGYAVMPMDTVRKIAAAVAEGDHGEG